MSSLILSRLLVSVHQVVMKALDPVFEIQNPYTPHVQGEVLCS